MRDGPCSGSGTSIFLIAAIHDFVMLNALAEAASTRAALGQAVDFLKRVLAPKPDGEHEHIQQIPFRGESFALSFSGSRG